MPTKRLVSFIGDRTPAFSGEIQLMNPKLFKGKVPALADYVISDDPEVVRLFEEKGVIDYAKVQSQGESPGSASGRSEESDSTDAESGSDESNVSTKPEVREPDRELNDGVQKEEAKEQVIPDDWGSLPFFTQRSIARKFDSTANTKEDVVRILSQQ